MTTEQTPGVEPKRLVAIFYVLAAIFVGIFLEKVLGIVFSYARWNDFAVFGEDWTLTTVIGYAVAIGAAVAVWRTPRSREVSFEVAAELKKVTWPTLRETRAATVAVVVTTFVAAMLLGVFDFVWARLSELIY
ncbi:MAG TPA: preprotein translocase subunit SecE [Anaeromyxobacteraceae bacterium]|jgi:preprotein translocase subunit SecE|nr:preprotein translocase subunit SecE [Anaeromyxobacteraceae bacterium]